jgi:hypothetical protein
MQIFNVLSPRDRQLYLKMEQHVKRRFPENYKIAIKSLGVPDLYTTPAAKVTRGHFRQLLMFYLAENAIQPFVELNQIYRSREVAREYLV